MKVRCGSLYLYTATGLDAVRPVTRETISNGSLVKVGNLRGCPKANTAGQCYVFCPISNKFLGMVSTNSLTPAKVKGHRVITTKPSLEGETNEPITKAA